MKQTMLLTLEIDQNTSILNVLEWMKETIQGSRVTEVSMKDMDLIYWGTLNTFLGEFIIHSTAVISPDQLKHLFSPRPHFIHQMKFKAFK